MKHNLLALLFGLVVAAVLLEVVFRILPTSDAHKALDVNDTNPHLRYPPHREMFVSIGRQFEIQHTKRTNNLGFYADQDYVGGDGRRKIALIGDSFVEARHVDNAEAVQARLQQQLDADYDVYGLAFSGSPLSQYLAYAALADATFAPKMFVFLIIPNDYDESMLRYRPMPGYHYFDDDGILQRIDFSSSLAKRMLRFSATARYLALNLELYNWWALPAGIETDAFVSNMPRYVPAERLVFSKQAADYFLQQLQARADGRPVLLVFPAIHDAIYADRPVEEYADSFVSTMNRYLAEQAGSRGFHVLDLQAAFTDDFALHGQRFEFPFDNHWNARGHDVAARAIADTLSGLGLVAAAADAAK